MIYGLFILVVTGGLAMALIHAQHFRVKEPDLKLLRSLFYYHSGLAFVYFLYAAFNPSDSVLYYFKVLELQKGENWFDYFGSGTAFIEFLVYPFVHLFNFTYEACMALFSFFGFIGFVFFYLFFKENIYFKHTFWGYDLIKLIFFLPNLHFWSSSLGKGSVIFMGFGILFFGLNKPVKRWWALLLGGLIIYYVRPHIMFVVLASAVVAFAFSSRGLSVAYRILILVVSGIAFVYIYQDVMQMVGVDETELLSGNLDFTHRSTELAKATSGVDLTNYNLPMLLFTFLFRPLFVDAQGALGFIVSFENVFYLLIFFRLVSGEGIRFLITADYITKTAFFSFLTVAVALAQVSGNLGIAMRQKSQVMILMMFVILKFMDEQKMMQWKTLQARKRVKAALRAIHDKAVQT